MVSAQGRGSRTRTGRIALVPLALGVLLLLLAVSLGFAPAAASAATHLTLAAVGDVMGHTALVDSAWSDASGSYDFHPILAPVAPYLKAADYTIASLETPLAGPELGYSGYPAFNSPASYAAALKDFGVDFMGTANNHSLDKGWIGIYRTLDFLDDLGIAHAGTARSYAEQQQPFLVTVKGVRLAIIDYTYGTNDIPLPSGRPYAVNYVKGDDMIAEAMIAEAKKARGLGAELVIAFVHWGSEYERVPDSTQRNLASRLLNNGVDAIIGSHPHVVQPIARVSGTVGGRSRDLYVAYSLGNFSSNQRDRYTDSGIILYLDIVKDDASGDMRADDPMTRQQFAKLIALTLGLQVTEANECAFKDVTHSGADSLYPDNFVAAVAARGITTGRSSSIFAPYEDIARGQVVSMGCTGPQTARAGPATRGLSGRVGCSAQPYPQPQRRHGRAQRPVGRSSPGRSGPLGCHEPR